MSIQNLEPKSVWKNFYSLTQIPRPSKKEGKVIEFLKEFGKTHNLETIVDEVGNVIFRKAATAGMENRKGIVMQAHIDMVPQKNSDKVHDFEKDPIEAYVDGDWVTANGTTLGADNGMGVAAAMAILESTDIEHGPVEALFTVDEEAGMGGAFGLKPGLLQGDILLNLDSEDEGELYVGCAGGINANMQKKYEAEELSGDYTAYKLVLKGLKGGHSGLDINMGRGNSNKLLFRFLKHAQKQHNLRIAEVIGGSLRNAIPRESFATVVIPASANEKFQKCLKTYEDIFKAELKATEPTLEFTATATDLPKEVLPADVQKDFINAIYACPNGVIRFSDEMHGLVETSTNIAIVTARKGALKAQCLLRSSVDSAKDDLAEMISSTFELAGFEVDLGGEYPGWKPNMDSAILNTMKDVYNNLYGKIPEIKAIHAGLECGLLGGVYPNWDMISFGPTIRFPHSPDEKIKIDTVQKFWDYLVETLKNVPVK